MRAIDADAMIDRLKEWDTKDKTDKALYNFTLNRINEQPTIQPEIVRCKDCKHWIPYDWMFNVVWRSKNIADYPEDEIGCNLSDMAMKANDFCSRGKERGDGMKWEEEYSERFDTLRKNRVETSFL